MPKLKGFHSSQYYHYREDCNEKRLIFTISNDASKLIQGLFELVCIESFLIMIVWALQPHNDFSASDTLKTSFVIKPNPLNARLKLIIIAPQAIHHNKHLIHSGILALQIVKKIFMFITKFRQWCMHRRKIKHTITTHLQNNSFISFSIRAVASRDS